MKLLCHGGRCCGIKHICSLGLTPVAQANPISKIEEVYGASRQEKNPGKNFFFGEAPLESYKDRFKRYVKFCKDNQKGWSSVGHGLIEVTILPTTQSKWIPVLKAEGFTETLEFTNGNTNHEISVWHLSY